MNKPIVRAIQPTALVAPSDMRILNENTKICIRMKEAVERIVPPDFVGLALAAGALPGEMYEKQYGQYTNTEGVLIGEAQVVHDEEDESIVIMPERLPAKQVLAEDRDVMEDTTEVDQKTILGAIQKVLDKVAEKPDQRAKFLSADGRPKVPALEEIIGKDITAAQRDAAWDSMTASA